MKKKIDVSQKQLDEYAEKLVQMERLKNQAEFLAQQSQISPHFLYNTLDTIRGKALASGNEDIANMTERLSRMFRYTISNKSNMSSVSDEINNAADYVYIQQIRFNNRFSFFSRAEEDDWRLMYFKIPKLTIQPIVENAIRHGLEGMVSGGVVTLNAYRTNDQVVIRVVDNGKGMSQDKVEAICRKLRGEDNDITGTSTGIGLANINQRIRYLYGENYGMTVASTEGLGTTVEVIMPYLEKE